MGLPRPELAASRQAASKCSDGKRELSSTHSKGKSLAIVTVGIDLAKNVFAAHGVNEAGKPELVHPSVPHAKLHELIATLPPCVIGMEACTGAQHWARLLYCGLRRARRECS
jgi:hypothetical protein